MAEQHATIDCATGEVQVVDLSPDEQAAYDAQQTAAAQAHAATQAAQAAAQTAAQAAAQQRAADLAHLLNSPIARDSQLSRDAYARVLGIQPLRIPLTQDAGAQDIAPLS